MSREPRQRDHRWDNISQNSRSQGVSRGRRVPDRWRTRTWCCRARCSKTRSQRSRRLRRHPRSHASNIHIDLPDTQTRSQIIMDSRDQVLRNHTADFRASIRLSALFDQPVNSDSIRPSCQRIEFNLHTLKMTAAGRVILRMPDYTQKPLAQPTALHGPSTQPGRA